MNDSHEQTIHRDRLELFINLIKKEFPDGKIEFEYDPPRTPIKVSQNKAVPLQKRNPNIVFDPDVAFMTDEDSDYERTMNNGIRTAKQIFENPLFKDKNHQGTIYLKQEGVDFNPKE